MDHVGNINVLLLLHKKRMIIPEVIGITKVKSVDNGEILFKVKYPNPLGAGWEDEMYDSYDLAEQRFESLKQKIIEVQLLIDLSVNGKTVDEELIMKYKYEQYD